MSYQVERHYTRLSPTPTTSSSPSPLSGFHYLNRIIFDNLFTVVNVAVENGWVSDRIVRMGIRRLLKKRHEECVDGGEKERSRVLRILQNGEIAIKTDKANDQHYELPSLFFLRTLGPFLKYSCCLFTLPTDTLADAEIAMMRLYVQRAQLEDGMKVLDLGCGWGSLTFFLLENFPNMEVVSVSNSSSQRAFIQQRAREKGLERRLNIITADINVLSFPTAVTTSSSPSCLGVSSASVLSPSSSSPSSSSRRPRTITSPFDRIIAIECFEHMRNWPRLLSKIASWLSHDDGKLFAHFFAHRQFPYLFEVRGKADWMTQYFFEGGMMPSYDLIPQLISDAPQATPTTTLPSSLYSRMDKSSDKEGLLSSCNSNCSIPLETQGRWWVNGKHYQLTSEEWLKRLDVAAKTPEMILAFRETYGKEAAVWLQRWRMFYMAVAECFGYDEGELWGVTHVLLKRKSDETK